MPTASARGAAFTDCQYVAIAGIWVQAWPPLTLFFLFLGQAKSRTADRSDPGATAVAKLIIELRKRANAIPSAGANGLARTVKVSRRRNSGAADEFLSGARNAHKHSAELSHEVSAPTKEDDEGTNVGVGTALCSQSAPRKT
jgi:hypothetical protein